METQIALASMVFCAHIEVPADLLCSIGVIMRRMATETKAEMIKILGVIYSIGDYYDGSLHAQLMGFASFATRIAIVFWQIIDKIVPLSDGSLHGCFSN